MKRKRKKKRNYRSKMKNRRKKKGGIKDNSQSSSKVKNTQEENARKTDQTTESPIKKNKKSRKSPLFPPIKSSLDSSSIVFPFYYSSEIIVGNTISNQLLVPHSFINWKIYPIGSIVQLSFPEKDLKLICQLNVNSYSEDFVFLNSESLIIPRNKKEELDRINPFEILKSQLQVIIKPIRTTSRNKRPNHFFNHSKPIDITIVINSLNDTNHSSENEDDEPFNDREIKQVFLSEFHNVAISAPCEILFSSPFSPGSEFLKRVKKRYKINDSTSIKAKIDLSQNNIEPKNEYLHFGRITMNRTTIRTIRQLRPKNDFENENEMSQEPETDFLNDTNFRFFQDLDKRVRSIMKYSSMLSYSAILITGERDSGKSTGVKTFLKNYASHPSEYIDFRELRTPLLTNTEEEESTKMIESPSFRFYVLDHLDTLIDLSQTNNKKKTLKKFIRNLLPEDSFPVRYFPVFIGLFTARSSSSVLETQEFFYSLFPRNERRNRKRLFYEVKMNDLEFGERKECWNGLVVENEKMMKGRDDLRGFLRKKEREIVGICSGLNIGDFVSIRKEFGLFLIKCGEEKKDWEVFEALVRLIKKEKRKKETFQGDRFVESFEGASGGERDEKKENRSKNETLLPIEESTRRSGREGKKEGGHWEGIGGLGKVKERLRQCIEWPLTRRKAFERLGFSEKPVRGILLYGPPGCGKTSLAKAISRQARFSFFYLNSASVYSPYVGDAEACVRNVFRRARQAGPSLLFLDELDALVGNRGGEGSAGGVERRVLSSLLNEMDGMEETKDLVIIGATNRPDRLDSALLRPGRFDYLIYVPRPDREGREEIIRSRTVGMDGSMDEILDLSKGMTGAEIEWWIQEASLSAIRNRRKVVLKDDFVQSLSLIYVTPKEDIERYKNFFQNFQKL